MVCSVDYRVSSFNVTDRTAFILSDQGEITAEDDQRTISIFWPSSISVRLHHRTDRYGVVSTANSINAYVDIEKYSKKIFMDFPVFAVIEIPPNEFVR